MEPIPEPGFFGKLPTYGDFIQKRLPRDFVQPWDDWLQVGIAAAKERLPEQWLTHYLNCPAWKFVMSSGICGDQACAGVTIPSVDRVGRYFNFTLANMLPVYTAPAHFLIHQFDWLEKLEDLAITVLEQEMDQDQLETALADFSVLPVELERERPVFERGEDYLRLVFREPTESPEQIQALLHELVQANRDEGYGIWVQRGSHQVHAQILVCRGMPTTDQFLDLMMNEDAEDSTVNDDGDLIDQFLSS